MQKAKKKINPVVEILMRRDGLSREDAEREVAICREDLLNGNYEAIMDDLGLEDDYIVDILL